jgi:hypothetical protein
MTFMHAWAQEESSRGKGKSEKQKVRKEKISNLIRQQEEGALIFNKQTAYGFRLNTDGWSLFFEKGYLKSPKVTNLFSLEFGEKKHPKETKTAGAPQSLFISGTPYVYGKKNIFYQLKPNIGQQRMFGGKTNKNGLAVHFVYAGGISLGLERPYYVKVENPGPSGKEDIKYTIQDSAAFLAPGNIIMGTGFRYGWREMKIVPGVHLKTAMRFDYGRFNEMVSAIEVGVNFEAYSRKIEQMLKNPANQTFFNGYVAILFGKRK